MHTPTFVGGISDTYMLKRVGARTDSCGTPFLRRFSRLLSLSLSRRQDKCSSANDFAGECDHPPI